ncbi:MAG: tetratricopeptide repeat protein [candidate division NC10 bacterium]|nr:tetratricopeptide repeat protein [candidate division NC10 bacterium]MDE2320906.1 tetratricopeptide repeat protein [candidate division NC10 bacterium]
MRLFPPLVAALTLSVLTVGCEGDVPLRMVQRDVDSTKSELAAVSRTAEGTRMFLEERLKKLEGRLDKSERARGAIEERLSKIDQGFVQSQAALAAKLDELTAESRLAQGHTEEVGHGVAEMSRQIDESKRQLDQLGRRMNGFDTQVNQAVVAAQEARGISQQTAQQVTASLQQMAQQTNAAIEQVNATAQLALTEARKTTKGKPITGAAGSSRAGTQSPPPAVAPITAPPPVPPAPAAQAPPQEVTPPPPAARKAESPSTPGQAARPMTSLQSADELYSHALTDYTKGNYESAINGFRSIIELYPDSKRLPSARYWLGESYYSQKNSDQAIKEFELLIKQFPKSQEAKRAKGRLNQVK